MTTNKTIILILSVVIFSGLYSGCGNSNSEIQETDNAEVPVANENPKDEKLHQLEVESSRLRAGGSIKSVELNEGKAKILYVKDYAEYKKINPQSSLSEKDLKGYWESGDAIEKALVDGSVRIMRKLDYINQVQIILPYQGKTYSIDVSKPELETFIGSDFNSIVNNWDDKFSNPYVYNDDGRQKFFNKFGKII